MSRLVRYAGYDPKENQFGSPTRRSRTSAINFAMARACRHRIDAELAVDLKRVGLRARHIGVVLAHLDGRSMPYAAISVYRALKQ